MKNLRRVLMLGVLVVAVMLTGCQSTKKEGKDLEVFKVGMECGYPPFNWTQLDDKNGAVQIEGTNEYANGYDVQMAKKVAESIGKKLVIVKTEWDGLIPAVNSGIIDSVMAGMSPTEDRKQAVDFSDAYYNSDLVIVVKKGGPFDKAKNISDFKGAKITAQLNTFHYSVIDQIKDVNKLEAMVDFPTMRVALQSGVIDGYISEKPEAISATKALKDLTFIDFGDNGFKASKADTDIAAALKKGSDLTAKINEALSKISKEDRAKIMEEAIQNQINIK